MNPQKINSFVKVNEVAKATTKAKAPLFACRLLHVRTHVKAGLKNWQ